jgi:hypothetical protein
MIRIPIALAALALLICAPAAIAAPEEGDAGDLPATAQDLSGETVTRIDGEIASTEDIDMYRVCVSGDGSFSASTVGGTSLDTQLFLFDASGRGVYANDDVQLGVGQSRLPDQHPLTPRTPGDYLLAIGPYNLDPRSSGGPTGSIFPVDDPGVVGPSGDGGDEPIVVWGGRASESETGAYSIFLTGTECPPPDTTPPEVELLSPLDGVEVVRNQPVTVVFSCSDAGGSLLASCVGTVDSGEQLDTSQLGPVSVTVVARDNAGNEASVTHTVTVVEPQDRIAPTIKLFAPLDGAVYLLDQEVLADYLCEDEGGSGLVACDGDVDDGAPVDTGSVGSHEFGVHAADGAGNTADTTAAYRVIYDFDGFLRPVKNRPRVNEVQPGRMVPIRFELGGSQGLDVIEEGWPQVAEVDCDFGEEPEGGVPAKHPRWFRELVYRKRKGRYLFLWKTDRSWGGSCRQFMLKLKDGTVKRADFRFAKHGSDRHDD